MANELATPRAFELVRSINSNQMLIDKHKVSMVDLGIESGRWLIELKDEVAHGSYMSFCEEHVRVGRTQRQKYVDAAKAPADVVIEYKESDNADQGLDGLMRMINKPPNSKRSNYQSTGNSEDQSEPEKVERWTDEDLAEEFKSNPVEKVVYGVDDLPKLTANVLHAGILLDNIIEHVDLTPEQFAAHLSREITHDGDRPRSASVVAEYTARVEMFMDLIVQTRGLLETKPTLEVI